MCNTLLLVLLCLPFEGLLIFAAIFIARRYARKQASFTAFFDIFFYASFDECKLMSAFFFLFFSLAQPQHDRHLRLPGLQQ
jgi:hypothetical protein